MSDEPVLETPNAAKGVGEVVKDVLAEHAPKAAEHGARATAAGRKAFLEELETYNAEMLGDLIDSMRASGSIPPEIDKMLEAIKAPTAQIGGILSSFFIYGVMLQLASSVLQPFFQATSNDIWAAHPTKPLSPADLAVGAVRGIVPGGPAITSYPEEINAIAGESGISAADMQYLANITGNPPSPQDLLEMKRRGIITLAQLATGLKEGDTRDEWIPMFEQLINQWITPTDFVAAAVREQVTRPVAQAWANAAGLDTGWDVSQYPGPQLEVGTPPEEPAVNMFDLLFDIAGRPPGPQELGHMANRKLIDWTNADAGLPSPDPTAITFEQGIAESDIKTKYTAVLQALQVYVPPPRMVTGLLEKGGITEDPARLYWQYGGVPASLVDAYVYEATQQATIQDKLLAKGDILTAYYDQVIDNATATELLDLLGFTGAVAEFQLATVDMRREIKALNAEVNRIGSYYMHYKLTEVGAENALTTLGVPAGQIQGLLSIWSVDRIVPNRLPTTSQISKAVQYGTLTVNEALSKLELLGFTAYDAAIVLSAEGEIQITPLPAETGTETQV